MESNTTHSSPLRSNHSTQSLSQASRATEIQPIQIHRETQSHRWEQKIKAPRFSFRSESEHFPTYRMMSEFSHGLLVAGPPRPSIITPLLKSPHFTSPCAPFVSANPPPLFSSSSRLRPCRQTDTFQRQVRLLTDRASYTRCE